MKISGRDIKIFMLGFFSFFLVETLYDWESSVKAFERGLGQWSTEKSK